MKKPKIEINGKTYEIKPIKARDWRRFFKFDEERKDLLTVEFIEKHCELLAGMFEDFITIDELLNHLTVSEVINLYDECLKYFLSLLTEKLGEVKNAEETAENQTT
ncbi:MAG: hypothetical protein IJ728_00850 [Selenomonadaceae bacterium]|nr:hypothetical protein [Selenomonadaceae bacterium]